MQQYPPPQRACGRCERPAVYRVALVDLGEKPSIALARRSHYRCPPCFLASLTPPALAGPARDRQYVVVDPAYTAAALAAVTS